MTAEQVAAIVNRSVQIAKEVAAMPVKTDMALHRALMAAKAADRAINAFNAEREYRALISRVAA